MHKITDSSFRAVRPRNLGDVISIYHSTGQRDLRYLLRANREGNDVLLRVNRSILRYRL